MGIIVCTVAGLSVFGVFILIKILFTPPRRIPDLSKQEIDRIKRDTEVRGEINKWRIENEKLKRKLLAQKQGSMDALKPNEAYAISASHNEELPPAYMSEMEQIYFEIRVASIAGKTSIAWLPSPYGDSSGTGIKAPSKVAQEQLRSENYRVDVWDYKSSDPYYSYRVYEHVRVSWA